MASDAGAVRGGDAALLSGERGMAVLAVVVAVVATVATLESAAVSQSGTALGRCAGGADADDDAASANDAVTETGMAQGARLTRRRRVCGRCSGGGGGGDEETDRRRTDEGVRSSTSTITALAFLRRGSREVGFARAPCGRCLRNEVEWVRKVIQFLGESGNL